MDKDSCAYASNFPERSFLTFYDRFVTQEALNGAFPFSPETLADLNPLLVFETTMGGESSADPPRDGATDSGVLETTTSAAYSFQGTATASRSSVRTLHYPVA